MSNIFANTVIECPHCKTTPEYKKTRLRPQLECNERNYHGYRVDHANCPECGKGYEISYKIDEVTKLGKDWDCMTREEREEHEKQCKINEINRKQDEIDKLKKELKIIPK